MASFLGRRHRRLGVVFSVYYYYNTAVVLFTSSSLSTSLLLIPPTAKISTQHQLLCGVPFTSTSPRFSTISSIPTTHTTHTTFDAQLRPPFTCLYSNPKKNRGDIDLTALPSASNEVAPIESTSSTKKEVASISIKQDIQNIITLVGAQALLIPVSIALANDDVLNIPNKGLGLGFAWTSSAFITGLQWTVPLFAVAGVMRILEPHSQALQEVTKATQRSVLAVMGKKRRPVFALFVSILLGAVAGCGEEWLFRGVFQTSLSAKFGQNVALGLSGVVFGLLHAVTPLYSILAATASLFFGYLYNISHNLAVPMICHAVYDIGALLWAHFSVTGLSNKEQNEILESGPGAPILDAGPLSKAN